MEATHSQKRPYGGIPVSIDKEQVEHDIDITAKEFANLTGIKIDPSNIMVVLRGANPIDSARLKNRMPLVLNAEPYLEDLRIMMHAPEKSRGALAFNILVRYSANNLCPGIVRAAELAQEPNKYGRVSTEMSDFFSKRASDEADRQYQASMGKFLGVTYLGSLSKLFAAHMLSDSAPIIGPFSSMNITNDAILPSSDTETSTAEVCGLLAEKVLEKRGVTMTPAQIAHHKAMWAKVAGRRLTSEPKILELIAEAAYLIIGERAKELSGKEQADALKAEIAAITHSIANLESALLAECLVSRGDKTAILRNPTALIDVYGEYLRRDDGRMYA